MDDDSVQLADMCRTGDSDAARRLYDRYVERLIALARCRLSRRLARRVDPEDVVQSAYRSFFIRMRRGEYAIRRSGELWRLLAGITLHKLLGQVEHHTAARRAIEREAVDGERSMALAQLAAAGPSAEHVVALADELSRLLAAMTPLDREVFELRLRGLTIEEIAARSGRSERTVRRVLATQKRMLAEQFHVVSELAGDEIHADPARTRNRIKSRPALVVPFDGEAPLPYRDFVLKRLIGVGGMGKVYAAVQRSLIKPVAVKVLRKARRGDAEAVARFLGEARTAARLRHPNIVDVHGIGRLPHGGYFIVMDLVDGDDLSRHLRRGPLEPGEAVRIVATAALAIEHAHRQGVIHCDLKPSNLLLDRRGAVLVTDFGLAQPIAGGESVPAGGTAAFMAPEQIEFERGPLGPATDVYGLGALLYMLLTGRPPFVGASIDDVLDQVVSADSPPAPHVLQPLVSEKLSQHCLQCLNKSPAARFPTAAALASALLESHAGD